MTSSWNEIRQRASRLRDISLEAVLEHLGAERDRYDRAKWHTAQGTLSVTGGKFMNWNHGVGGGGAIDLVMHLKESDFMGALEWLSHRFADNAFCLPAKSSKPRPPRRRALELPSQDKSKRSLLFRYLVCERRLPPSILSPLVQTAIIYADVKANVVFLLLGEEKQPIGAEIRGTTSRSWHAMAPGSQKDLGYFCVSPPNPTSIVLCESAIDALSLCALRPNTLCVSTAGARANPLWLPSLLERNCPVYCGFDADAAGDNMARAMTSIHPRVQRLRPPLKDWNNLLKSLS